MALQHDQLPGVAVPPPQPPLAPWRKALERTLLIVGGIALVVGLVITFGGDDQTIGIGDWWWETGEITAPWQYGFLIGGAVLVVASLGLIIQRRRG